MRGAPLLALIPAALAAAQSSRSIDRADYTDRLRAMWLGQAIANWTGRLTEGRRIEPPFFTDADWGTTPPGFNTPIDFILDQDPWLADDDTDVEYVYLHLMHQHARPLLTGPEIRAGWLAHMDPAFIWVSNRRAWELMNRAITPPATGMAAANEFYPFIDAQLTTEFFGALAPGMPEEALRYAHLPIHTTAYGYSAHAAQFYAILYSLATQAPPSLSGRDKALWLVRQTRAWIPSTSKSADIADFVLADFLANPDLNDWELTRDRIADRYMINAGAHGFWYYAWPESSVNFACGVMALLYGQCDYRRTIQIGTLSGWDSDNCTATLGGLLGLMLGYDALTAQFPGQAFSDRFDIEITRNNLPDYLPADPQAQDTFTLMAQRMLPLIDQAVSSAGGSVSATRWVLPTSVIGPRVEANPIQIEFRRSANNGVRLRAGQVTCSSSASGNPPWPPWTFGIGSPSFIANGFETDSAGRDAEDARKYFLSTRGSGQPPGTTQTLTVEYSLPVEVSTIRFTEGDNWPDGGYFQSLTVELKIDNTWTPVAAPPSQPLDPLVPFQIIDFVLPIPVTATGIRISGPSGGTAGFITCCELDALAPATPFRRLNVQRGN